MKQLEQRAYFFDAGLRFACRRCGACCTGAPGIVRVTEREIAAIAGHLDLPVERVIERYLTVGEDGYRIMEEGDGRCLFYDNGCRLYPVRPSQCRTFPFWFRNLRAEFRWEAAVRECPGIGTGKYYSRDTILDILATEMASTDF